MSVVEVSVKIFLDDLRPTPEGWIRCYWPAEVIEHLKTGMVTEISLDHDLGDAEKASQESRREITGKDVLLWIEEQVFLHDFKPPVMRVHSDNASGVEAMRLAIQAINRRAGH